MPRIVDTLKAILEETHGAAGANGAVGQTLSLAMEEEPNELAEDSNGREQPTDLVDDEESEQFLFIEVGGPNKYLEGSPEVMGLAGNSVAPPVAKAPADMPPAIVDDAEKTAVSFQPWPDAAASTSDDIAPELIAYHQPDHHVSKQYAALLEQLLAGLEKKKALLFTSFETEENATATALNLAVCAGRSNDRKVVVVDANWKRPLVAEWLGVQVAPGLQEVIAGSAALEAVLQTTRVNDLQILAAGAVTGDACLWTADALHWITSWLRSRFDLAFVDAGLWEEDAAIDIVRSISDAVFPVVTESSPDADRISGGIKKICAAGGHVPGVIYFNPASLAVP